MLFRVGGRKNRAPEKLEYYQYTLFMGRKAPHPAAGEFWPRQRLPRILTPTAAALVPTMQGETNTGGPMATTVRPKAGQSQQAHRALLDTARTILTAQGYAPATTEEIVRRAGVTRGALYSHFRDKAALFEAAHRVYRRSGRPGLVQRAAPGADRCLVAGAVCPVDGGGDH